MFVLPVQLVAPSRSTKLMLVTPLQVSVAVAVPVLLVVDNTVHSIVMFAGQTITGGTVSLKLIVWTQLAVFPQPSAAVQVRVMFVLPVRSEERRAGKKRRFRRPPYH